MTLKMKESAKRNLDRLIGECVHSTVVPRFRLELDAILRDGFEQPEPEPQSTVEQPEPGSGE